MFFNYQLFFAQTFLPNPSGSSTVDSIVSIFTNKFNVEPDSVPGALDKLWDIAMDGSMYQIVCRLGLFIAVVAVGFWCVKFYKTLDEGGLRPAINDLVFPILLVVLLSNGGGNMKNLTNFTRDAMNGFNRSINTVIDSEVSLTAARKVLGFADVSTSIIDANVAACHSITELDKLSECLRYKEIAANYQINLAAGRFFDISPVKTGNSADWQAQVTKWREHIKDYSKNSFNLSNVIKVSSTGKETDITKISRFEDTEELRRIILSFRGSFLYIIEVMMLITGLIGPIFVALSMFPVGTKPMIAWGTSFLSLGFCKICFSLISGLSSLAMVYSDPGNVDMLVAAIVLGLLAPILAFSIASGTGLSALTTVAYSGQAFKINTGVGFYSPSTGDGLVQQPDAKLNSQTSNHK
jgi:hypothetical protein